MNREQAEHILDAYLSVCHKVYADGIYPDTESEKTRDALREVILDAMTEYRVKSNEADPDCSAMLYKMFTENMKHEPCHDYEPRFEALGIEVSE